MYIYIDESGQFIPLNKARSRAAAVVALVVPGGQRVALVREFKKTKKRLRPRTLELKGSSLSEWEAAEILAMLGKYDLILEAVVLDVGQHYDDDVTRFKLQQSEKLLEHITREHQPTLIQQLLETQVRLAGLPNQLFIQAFCMFELLSRLLETATIYYSQRAPQQLGRFHWRVDAKSQSLTTVERLWTLLLLPIIYTRSLERPMGMIPGGDYSFFGRFDAAPDPDDPPRRGYYRTDLKRVFREDLRFLDSKDDLGLQIADIVAAILTRALNGTLQESGWRGLGRILVRRAEQTVHLIALSPDVRQPTTESVANETWARVITVLERSAKPMITAQVWKQLEEGGA